MANVEFILIQNAIDCKLNKLNNVRLTESNKMIINSKGNSIEKSLKDTDNSEQCNYIKCDYVCIGDSKYVSDSNTWNSFFSEDEISKIKIVIKKIFKQQFISELTIIIKKINKILGKEITKETIYQALSEIIDNKERVYDQYNRIGYIKEFDEYYIFQPVELEPNTPLLYRYIPNFKRPEFININYKIKNPTFKLKKVSDKKQKISFDYDTYLQKLLIIRNNTDTYVDKAYLPCSYYRSRIAGQNYDNIPTLDDIKTHLFYSVYENGLDLINSTDRMMILKHILEKKISDDYKEGSLSVIEQLILDYYSRKNTIQYILYANDFDTKDKRKNIEGFRFITNIGKFIFKKNSENKLVQIDSGYNHLKFKTSDVEHLNSNKIKKYGFIETKIKRDKTSANEFVIINKDEVGYTEHKTLLKKHNKKFDRTGALCGQAKGAKDISHLETIIKSFVGDKYTQEDKKKSRKVLPHKNYNDSNKLLPKRTMCQEIELLLRYNDFKSLDKDKRYFYTYEERLSELELIKQKIDNNYIKFILLL